MSGTPTVQSAEKFADHVVNDGMTVAETTALTRVRDSAIRAQALEDAALTACNFPADGHGSLPTKPVQCARQTAMEITAAIRNLKEPT